MHQFAEILKKGLEDSILDPFGGAVAAQDGEVRHMGVAASSWLCDDVVGGVPTFTARSPQMVRELGIYRDKIPTEKEGKPREDFDRIR